MNARPDKALIEEVAALRQLLPAFVEKDWYVTQAVAFISQVNVADFQAVFTGGTCLSKAHGLLERFSEDVDLRVIAKGRPKRRTLSDYKQTIVEALRSGGFAFNNEQIKARDENRYFSIDLAYPTEFANALALRPHIQIEVSIRAMQLAPVALPVASFVNAAIKKPAEISAILCIDPAESAADKLSALAWRVLDRIRGNKYDDPSLVRHIHDLAMLKDTALAHSDFTALVMAAMADDAQRPKNKPELIEIGAHDKLAQMLNILSSDAQYLQEYARFVGGVSYADAKNIPHYAAALNAVRTLVQAVRK
jgi:predicted nucleotidyltransferase component of viral defense system